MEEEDLNPMNYVSNLSDVMLILAVGIMLALILHWEVPVGGGAEQQEKQEDAAVTFSDDDLDVRTEIPENVTEFGQVYLDEETGTYYILRDGEEGGS